MTIITDAPATPPPGHRDVHVHRRRGVDGHHRVVVQVVVVVVVVVIIIVVIVVIPAVYDVHYQLE